MRRLQDVVIESTPEHFIGRTREQETFRLSLDRLINLRKSSRLMGWRDWQADDTFPRVFVFSGKGGIGKSTLIYRLNEICKEHKGVVTIFIDWEKEDFGSKADMMKIIHDRLASKGFASELKPLRDIAYEIRNTQAEAARKRQEFDEFVANLSRGLSGLAMGSLTQQQNLPLDQVSASALSEGVSFALQQVIGAGRTAEEHFREWLKEKWTPEKYTLYVHENRELSKRLVDGLDRIAQSHPLVFLFDTIEVVDQALIDLFLDIVYYGSNRILYVIAGQRDLSRRYEDLLGSQLVFTSQLTEFYVPDVEDYLKLRQIPKAEQLAPYVHSVTQGVPFGVRVVTDMLQNLGVRIEELLEELQKGDSRELSGEIEERVLERLLDVFFRHCTEENDLRYLYSLALVRRFDPDILAAMWRQNDKPIEVEKVIVSLAQRYPFVIAGPIRNEMDSTVKKFVRKALQRSPMMRRKVKEQLDKACTATRERLESLEKKDGNSPDKFYWNTEWQECALDLANLLLWSDPREGIRFLTHLFIDASILRHDFRKKLHHILGDADLASNLSRPEDQQLWQLLQNNLDTPEWEIAPTFRALYRLAEESYLRPVDKVRRAIFRAKEYLNLGEVDKGLREIENVPSDLIANLDEMIRYELSNLYIKLGTMLSDSDVQAACQYYQKALSLNPQNKIAYLRWGDTLYYNGRLPEALEKYSQALQIDSGFKQARSQYENISALVSTYSSERIYQIVQQADLIARSGRLEEALDLYRQASYLVDRGTKPERRLHNRIGMVLIWLGRYEEALKEYEKSGDIGALDGAGRA